MKSLEYFESKEQYLKIKKLISELEKTISEINDELYSIISASTDKTLQNKLLNLKRDIFNKREIKSINTDVKDKINTSLHDKINGYSTLRNEIKKAEEYQKQICDREIHELRMKVKEFSENEVLNLGLNLSSHSFSERLKKYASSSEINKEALKTEQSLIKYLTRISTKTSPFSYFTTTGISTISNNNSAAQIDELNPEKSNTLRVNNYLFKAIKELVFQVPAVKQILLVRINPFLKENNGNFEYIVNRNNIETIRKLSVTPELKFIIEFLNGQKEITYEKLIKSLVGEDSTAEDFSEISSYLDKLIDLGFIELDYIASGLDPYWYKKLWIYFSRKTFKYKDDLVNMLVKLDETINNFHNLDSKTREAALKEIFSLIEITLRKIYSENVTFFSDSDVKKSDEDIEKDFYRVFDLKAERIFYEDTKSDLNIPFSENEIMELIAPYDELLSIFENFELFTEDKDLMNYYFTNKFGESAEINFIDFYTSYYENLKKPLNLFINKKLKESRNQEDYRIYFQEFLEKFTLENNYNKYFFEKMIQRNKQNFDFLINFTEKYLDLMRKNNDEVILKISDLKKLKNDSYSEKFQKEVYTSGSYAAFIQLFRTNGKLKGVVNQVLTGYGKFFSRFLHLFDKILTENIKKSNNELMTDDIMLAENSDASFFNGNIHNPILQYEMYVPGSHNQVEPEFQINIFDVNIKYNKDNEELALYSKTHCKRLYVLDLGFQTLDYRSEMYMLLDKFSMFRYIFHNTVIETFKDKIFSGNKITIVPRIKIENDLVLHRKQWHIPKNKFPVLNIKDGNNYLVLNKWREDIGIPDEVFVKNKLKGNNDNIKMNRKFNLDDLKPQYISFNNPFTINLIISLMNKVEKYLILEEVMPEPEYLTSLNGRNYVTEHLIQWYKNDK
ncbi:MAG: lantibiotic dehydratase family protein [Ignavibacteria bacterium]|nr:lantibiotic dehydratase family protein [Ignavibacteria bacterium]